MTDPHELDEDALATAQNAATYSPHPTGSLGYFQDAIRAYLAAARREPAVSEVALAKLLREYRYADSRAQYGDLLFARWLIAHGVTVTTAERRAEEKP
jgi:hypothetical protein